MPGRLDGGREHQQQHWRCHVDSVVEPVQSWPSFVSRLSSPVSHLLYPSFVFRLPSPISPLSTPLSLHPSLLEGGRWLPEGVEGGLLSNTVYSDFEKVLTAEYLWRGKHFLRVWKRWRMTHEKGRKNTSVTRQKIAWCSDMWRYTRQDNMRRGAQLYWLLQKG